MVPAYAPGPYLDETLASARAAVDGRDDVEIVVVDDGSPGPIQLASVAHPAVRVHRFNDNVGAVPNFNRAISLARGELVHLLHADDTVEPGFYEAHDRSFADPATVASVCRSKRIDGEGIDIGIGRLEQQSPGPWAAAREVLATSNRVTASSITVRRSAYEKVGGFDERLSHAADWDMWVRLAFAGQLSYVPSSLASYRVHDGQHTADVMRTARNIAEAVEVIERLPHRPGVDQPRRRMAFAFAYRAAYAARTSGQAIRRGDIAVGWNQMRASARCLARSAVATVVSVRED